MISYRRRDSEAMTGRIFDWLVARYGRDAVFRDIDNIRPGMDFRAHISDALAGSDILLAIVGPNWAGRSSRAGQARIDDEDDLVRVEVETAIKRGIPVIPVLLGDTKMPGADRVPESLRDFVFRQALRVDPGRDFEHHMHRLTREIDMILQIARAKTQIEPPRLALPDKPSIAVLPFTNMSGDPEQEFFADGIAEDIITALSRYPSLFVIARNSSFTYKSRAVDIKQVGQELGVHYVLEGSLRRAGNRIRVTAQLVEAQTGKHVWAERYDRELTDIFTVQDEITEAVTIAIAPAVADAELQRALRKPPESLDAWAAYQRGLWHLQKATAHDYEMAKEFFRRAIDLDPNFPDGYCGLATAEIRAAGTFRVGSLAEAQSSAERLAYFALALDGNNAFAHSCLSVALCARGDHRGALAEADRAVALSPNLASGYFQRGTALIYSGRPQEGLKDLQTSLRLEPRGSDLVRSLHNEVMGLYFSRAYEKAVEVAQYLIRSFPEYPPGYRWLAAAYGQLGCVEGAKEALGKAMAITPAPFVRPRGPWYRPEDHAHFLEGLRKAGMQEE
jgi:adenylate cyclase